MFNKALKYSAMSLVAFGMFALNVSQTNSYFRDTESASFTMSAGYWEQPSLAGVVLNEFLPNPDGVQYGHDFGSDSDDMPKGEWVELYNNGNTAQDLAGWYLRDSLDLSDHKILIDTAHTGLATQIIGPKGFMVVFMNNALLNNDGDSVRLFNTNDVLIDSYSYTVPADFCNLKPTEGESNDEDGSGIGGGCTGTVPDNKSYARIPDGVGEWIDPVPTPGETNNFSEIQEFIIEEASGSAPSLVSDIEEVEEVASDLADEEIAGDSISDEEVLEVEQTEIIEDEIVVSDESTDPSNSEEMVTEAVEIETEKLMAGQESLLEPESAKEEEDQPVEEPEPEPAPIVEPEPEPEVPPAEEAAPVSEPSQPE